MKVMDHKDHKNGQDMYCRTQTAGQTDRNRLDKDSSRQEASAANTTGRPAEQEEKTSYANRLKTPSQNSGNPNNPVKQLRQRTETAKKPFGVSGTSTLYSSTTDLMAIANTENQEALRAIYVRLSFKLWSVRAAGVTNTNKNAIKSATRSIQKVMGKVKGKIKSLQKEDEMEKKAEAARKAKLRRLQQELRRELAIKRKIRRNKEQKDVADSYLESDGQYSVKSYKDHLPEEVRLQMELQQAGATGTVTADVSLSAADTLMAIDSSVTSMSAEAAISSVSADVGGSFVDLAL